MYGISTHNLVNNTEWALVDYYMYRDVVSGSNDTINSNEEVIQQQGAAVVQ